MGRIAHQSNVNHVLGSVEMIPNVGEVEAGTSIVVDADNKSLSQPFQDTGDMNRRQHIPATECEEGFPKSNSG